MSNNFDTSIKNFFELIFEIHDKKNGSMSSQKLWMIWANKFSNLYAKGVAKAKNSEAFYEPFLNFYSENENDINKPIFTENEDGNTLVNDSWLKNIENTKTKTNENDWSPSSSVCKGKIIYFDNTDPKLKAISIPVSEIYNCSILLYKEKGEKESVCKTYPAKFLFCFYKIYGCLLPENENIKNNITQLYEHIESLTPIKNTEGLNSNLGGVGKILSGVLSTAGIQNFDTKNIDKLINTASSEQNINKMGNVVKEVMSVFSNSSNSTNTEDIIGNIGKVIQSPIIKEVIGDITAMGGKEEKVEVEGKVEVEVEGEAEDQE
jgi:hypothetical protein